MVFKALEGRSRRSCSCAFYRLFGATPFLHVPPLKWNRNISAGQERERGVRSQLFCGRLEEGVHFPKHLDQTFKFVGFVEKVIGAKLLRDAAIDGVRIIAE